MILAIVITAIVFFFLGIATTYVVIIGSANEDYKETQNKSHENKS
jgi:hypothetical protein